MKKLVLAAVIVCAGCATTLKDMEPLGGSKADATVRMGYRVHEFEQALPNEDQALQSARARCAAWGYANAEPFGGGRTECEVRGGFSGCIWRRVTREYQCIDARPAKD